MPKTDKPRALYLLQSILQEMTKLTKKKEIDYQMVPNDSDESRVTTKWSQIASKLTKMTPKWSPSDS